MLPSVRRVVTGQDADGVGVYTHVEDVKGLVRSTGLGWYGIWGWEKQPVLPVSSKEPFVPVSIFPAADGLRVTTLVFPAGYRAGKGDAATPVPEPNDDDREYARLAAAHNAGTSRKGASAMHATDTIDIGVITSGEIILIQEDGTEEALRPGDVFIQNGAVHAWKNPYDQPCMMTCVILGAQRVSDC